MAEAKLVIIESPYAGSVKKNLAYAKKCMKDSLSRGEAPLASHLLYTQDGILNDRKSGERKAGIEAGLVWGAKADLTAVYTDLGISEGMKIGIKHAKKCRRKIEFRSIKR